MFNRFCYIQAFCGLKLGVDRSKVKVDRSRTKTGHMPVCMFAGSRELINIGKILENNETDDENFRRH
jgi:hypothetical protein